jgi:hypothetical protein
MVQLCNGDLDRPLKIEIFDHEKSGKHVFMGQVNASVRDLLASGGNGLNVIEPDKQAKKGAKYLNSGTFHASNCYVEENPTFSDVRHGLCVVDPVSCTPCAQLLLWARGLTTLLKITHRYSSSHAHAVHRGRLRDLAHGGHRLHCKQRRPGHAQLAALRQPRW